MTTKEDAQTEKPGASVNSIPTSDRRGRGSLKRVVQLHVAEKPTTGSKWADRMVDEAVDCALIKLKPIIRDELRKEIKRLLTIEEAE